MAPPEHGARAKFLAECLKKWSTCFLLHIDADLCVSGVRNRPRGPAAARAEGDVKLASFISILAPYVNDDGTLRLEDMGRDYPQWFRAAKPGTNACTLQTALSQPDQSSNTPFQIGLESLPDYWGNIDKGASARSVGRFVRVLDLLQQSDPVLAREIALGLVQVPIRLPAVDMILTQAPSERPFSGYVLVGVQHLLSTQAPLLRACEQLGVSSKDIFLSGKSYSSSPIMQRYFRAMGYTVAEGAGSLEAMHALFEQAWKRAQVENKKVLVLDDGGIFANWAEQRLGGEVNDDTARITVVEQTTRGITEARYRSQTPFPIINVAESPGKAEEAAFIGQSIARGLLHSAYAVTRAEFLPAPKIVTVVGYGRVGSAAAKALRDAGLEVRVVEIDSQKRKAASTAGFAAFSDVVEAIRGDARRVGCSAEPADMLLGATGVQSIGMRALEAMPLGSFVASASSGTVEISRVALARLRAKDAQRRTPRIHVLGDRLPINFSGGIENIEPDRIQLTRALMLQGALQAVQTHREALDWRAKGDTQHYREKLGVQALALGPQDALLRRMRPLWGGAPMVPIVPNTRAQQTTARHGASSRGDGAQAQRVQWDRRFEARSDLDTHRRQYTALDASSWHRLPPSIPKHARVKSLCVEGVMAAERARITVELESPYQHELQYGLPPWVTEVVDFALPPMEGKMEIPPRVVFCCADASGRCRVLTFDATTLAWHEAPTSFARENYRGLLWGEQLEPGMAGSNEPTHCNLYLRVDGQPDEDAYYRVMPVELVPTAASPDPTHPTAPSTASHRSTVV